MPVDNQDHGRVPVSVSVVLGGLDQLLDLGRRRLRNALFGRRTRETARFSVAGVTSFRCVLAMVCRLVPAFTARTIGFLRGMQVRSLDLLRRFASGHIVFLGD